MNLEQEILKRYTSNEKIHKGYYLRIREEKNGLNIKVYYHGIKMMEWNKKGLSINTAVFVPNGSNVFEHKKLIESYRKIPRAVEQDMKKIETYFEFSIGSDARGEKRKGKKLNIDFGTGTLRHTKEELMNMVVEQLKSAKMISCFTDIMLNGTASKILLFPKKENFSLIELYDLMIPLLEVTLASNELQKVKIEVQSKLKVDSLDFDEIEKIMERRIDVYATIDNQRTDDYRNSKSETNQEKQKQQDFMVLLNKEKKEDIFYRAKNGKEERLYSKNTVPFELEYTIYAGKDRKEVDEEDEKRKRSNIKGRIDNVVVDGTSLHLVEIKHGTGVIGGTNGIHKHLIDLYSCLTISQDIIFKEFEDRIKVRLETLTGRKQTIKLDQKFYYDIVCIYESNSKKESLTKEAVMNKIHEIYGKCATDKVVNCKIRKEKIIDIAPIKNDNANKYSKELLTKNVEELCDMLKSKNCIVRILLVDDELKEFIEYQF